MLFEDGDGRGFVLNKTNWQVCSQTWGDDTDRWLGQRIIICPEKANFQGKIVDCLRLRVPAVGPKGPGGSLPPSHAVVPPDPDSAESFNSADVFEDEEA